jgi:hypothetical protein
MTKIVCWAQGCQRIRKTWILELKCIGVRMDIDGRIVGGPGKVENKIVSKGKARQRLIRKACDGLAAGARRIA